MVGRVSLWLLLVCFVALVAVPQAFSRSQAKQLLVDKDKAQCPKAAFTSIQAAVTAASPGDTIKVCPDQYNESVSVTKPSLTLVGPTTVNPGQCSTVTAADPTRDAIVTGAGSYSFSLLNNNITISGFVAQGSVDGIDTSAAFSGYRITNNIAQNDVNWGMNLNSGGANQSRVDHNCMRLNGPGTNFLADGLASEGGNLTNALIDHNATYRNPGAGIDLSGAGARAYVTISNNSSVEDGHAINVDNSIGSSIDHNAAQNSVGSGIFIGGSNNGLGITNNTVTGGGSQGIRFDQANFIPVFPGANVGLNVSGNVVTGVAGSGIFADANAPNLTYSLVSNNSLSGNGFSGIQLGTMDDNNRVTNNGADKNGANGIYAAGAVGNTFANNHMSLNVQFDARDDNRPANTWTANQCITDSPPGTICGN